MEPKISRRRTRYSRQSASSSERWWSIRSLVAEFTTEIIGLAVVMAASCQSHGGHGRPRFHGLENLSESRRIRILPIPRIRQDRPDVPLREIGRIRVIRDPRSRSLYAQAVEPAHAASPPSQNWNRCQPWPGRSGHDADRRPPGPGHRPGPALHGPRDQPGNRSLQPVWLHPGWTHDLLRRRRWCPRDRAVEDRRHGWRDRAGQGHPSGHGQQRARPFCRAQRQPHLRRGASGFGLRTVEERRHLDRDRPDQRHHPRPERLCRPRPGGRRRIGLFQDRLRSVAARRRRPVLRRDLHHRRHPGRHAHFDTHPQHLGLEPDCRQRLALFQRR